ncbi:LysM peptidoglycan-binding domain-containing protein [Flavisolibacter sp. BT320]|nr:LysM peptidoglycan-binding domain-containing protein [Flavisolibacter longurius]
MLPGKLEKMIIEGFQKPDFRTGSLGRFAVQINPETFVRNYAIEYVDKNAPGKEGSQVEYNYSQPQTMDVEFILDGTGVLPPDGFPAGNPVSAAVKLDVKQKIEELKTVVYNYVGEKHEPPYVQLTWGTEIFKCRLQSLNVTYKIFKPDGTPLRASVKCAFKEHIPDQENAAVTEASSPDLTHVRLVKEGESLPLMCYQIYGDEKLYLEVARANGLTNFRELQTGQALFFPPLAKAVK